MNRRKFLTNSAAAAVGVAVGAGVVRKTMELQGTQTSRMLYRSYGGGMQRGGKSPLDRAVAKNQTFAYLYGSGNSPLHINCRCAMVRS